MKRNLIDILFILVGIIILWYISKQKASDKAFAKAHNFQGIIVGILFIVIGVIELFENYYVWKKF